MEKVSIVMCTYNGAKYLDEQIKSIIEQDYENIELIAVDDCSMDVTYSKLLQWHAEYPERIKVFQNEKNLGYNKNFEKALSLATGDYIAISDQDDIWMPNKISRQVDTIQKGKDIVLVHHNELKKKGQTVYRENNGNVQWRSDFEGSDSRRLLFFNQIVGHTILFRREMLVDFSIPEGLYYDWWLGLCATVRGRVKYLMEELTVHRLHDNNAFYSTEAPKARYDDTLIRSLGCFLQLEGITIKAATFAKKLLFLLQKNKKLPAGKMDMGLFLFLVWNRHIIFSPFRMRNPVYKELVLVKKSKNWSQK